MSPRTTWIRQQAARFDRWTGYNKTAEYADKLLIMRSRVLIAAHVAYLALSGDSAFFDRWETRHMNGYERLRKQERDEKELARFRAVPELQDGGLREAVKQLGLLRIRMKGQAREIRNMQEVAEYRNKQLASLHVVWCNGGCEGGVGCKQTLTRAVVLEAIRNVGRLVTWWNNHVYRLGPEEHEKQRVEWPKENND